MQRHRGGVFLDSVVREESIDLVSEAMMSLSPGGLIQHNDDLTSTMAKWEVTEGY